MPTFEKITCRFLGFAEAKLAAKTLAWFYRLIGSALTLTGLYGLACKTDVLVMKTCSETCYNNFGLLFLLLSWGTFQIRSSSELLLVTRDNVPKQCHLSTRLLTLETIFFSLMITKNYYYIPIALLWCYLTLFVHKLADNIMKGKTTRTVLSIYPTIPVAIPT